MCRNCILLYKGLVEVSEGKTFVYASPVGKFEVKKVSRTKPKNLILTDSFVGCEEFRQKTTLEALHDLNNEFKKLFAEIRKHKRSFFDFAIGIIIGTAVGGYFICFLGR